MLKMIQCLECLANDVNCLKKTVINDTVYVPINDVFALIDFYHSREVEETDWEKEAKKFMKESADPFIRDMKNKLF